MNSYPREAGFTEPTTSKEAAEAIEETGRAQTLRERVLWELRNSLDINHQWFTRGSYVFGLTADEIADRLNESVFSIRPRVAELHKRGLVEPTGERRKSSNGRSSHVWRLT